jgi:hypothetical protein
MKHSSEQTGRRNYRGKKRKAWITIRIWLLAITGLVAAISKLLSTLIQLLTLIKR